MLCSLDGVCLAGDQATAVCIPHVDDKRRRARRSGDDEPESGPEGVGGGFGREEEMRAWWEVFDSGKYSGRLGRGEG